QRGRRTVVVSSHNLEDVERLCTHVAVVGKGRLVRMDTVAAITHGTDRIVYTLSSAPGDAAAISSVVPGADLEWRDGGRMLVCSFNSEMGGVAEVNSLLLPALLAQTDIISVMPGQSLEEAFLIAKDV
ncbi:MAG: hypothetical protein J6N18_04455, partial [Kiritimatiellae bacterium]|nr:hypothetical protein [Kiritimatiellia bacterium]